MPSGKRKRRRSFWRDQAGVLASVAVALFGLVLGAAGAYSSGRGAAARAAAALERAGPLREGMVRDAALRENGTVAFAGRTDLVARIEGDAPLERIAPPSTTPRPKIIVIFDDMGPDPAAYEAVMALPGPLTLSFLPYAEGLQTLADRARGEGHAVMLHLPMQPDGPEDPGPQSLEASMTASRLLSELAWNLDRFTGYVAVNNHMGSRFTRNDAAMRTVLSVLAERGVYFVDSKTSAGSRASEAGAAVGAPVYVRDVFLDPDSGEELVRTQLARAERIARETGFVVAICHPRRDTLAVVGPWLTSALERGYDLATVEALPELDKAWRARTTLAMR